MPTTAAIAPALSGTTIKTLLQIATPATRMLEVISWGYSCNGNPGGTIELISTDVAATVTAHVAAGVQPLDPNIPASLVTLGVAATGYNASAEGSITATRTHDTQYVETASLPYEYQFMPDERPRIAISKFLRVRVTAGTTTGIFCWICWDE